MVENDDFYASKKPSGSKQSEKLERAADKKFARSKGLEQDEEEAVLIVSGEPLGR
jgi:hypothetical protein